jgi:hypothetical protein
VEAAGGGYWGYAAEEGRRVLTLPIQFARGNAADRSTYRQLINLARDNSDRRPIYNPRSPVIFHSVARIRTRIQKFGGSAKPVWPISSSASSSSPPNPPLSRPTAPMILNFGRIPKNKPSFPGINEWRAESRRTSNNNAIRIRQ